MTKDGLRTVVLSAPLVGICITATTASADVVSLVSQQHEAVTFVIVPPCGSPQSDVSQEQARDFDPFESDISTNLTCKVASATSGASQTSSISSTILSVSGGLHNVADSDVTAILHSISRSVYVVTFEITSEATYAIEGVITVAGDALPEQVADAKGFVRLLDANSTMLVNEFVTTTHGVSE
jgi:hypothetical protein